MLYTIYQVLLLLSAVTACISAAYVTRHKRMVSGAGELLGMHALAAFLCIVGACESLAATAETKFFCLRLCYVAYILVPATWISFMHKVILRRRASWYTMVAYGVSAVLLAVMAANPGNGFFRTINILEQNGRVYLQVVYGALFFIWYFVLAVFTAGNYALTGLGFRSGRITGRQTALITTAFSVTLIASLLYDFHVTPVELTPVAMNISVLLITRTFHRRFLGDVTADRYIFREMSDGALVLDTAGNLVQINDAALELLGVPDDKPESTAVELLGSRMPYRTQEGELIPRSEYEYTGLDGVRRNLVLTVTELSGKDNRPSGELIFLRDETGYRRQREQLEYLQNYDRVTGLANRAMFLQRLREETSASGQGKIAVIACNIDRFREYNELFGLAAGDQFLQQFGKHLQASGREGDLCARFSADEFYVLMPHLSGTQAEHEVVLTLTKILRLSEQPMQVGGRKVNLSVRAGIALYPDDISDTDELETLLALAASAMESVKTVGKNKYRFYSRESRREVEKRFHLVQDLYYAVEQDEFTQFSLEFQPQIDCARQRVVGVEALCRWKSPQHGAVSPAEFIPLAEETGLIGSLGLWVMEEVCRQAAAWRVQGLQQIMFSVNLSMRQLQSDGIADTLAAVCKRYGVPASQIVLEVTESIAVTHEAQVQTQMEKLRGHGFGIAIDDFAMGHSSFVYLKQFPVNTLKIDRVLSENVESDPVSAAVIRALSVLCETLNEQMVVEFVETAEQQRFLVQQGCNVFQGYFYSPPLPAGECIRFIHAFHARRAQELPQERGRAVAGK